MTNKKIKTKKQNMKNWEGTSTFSKAWNSTSQSWSGFLAPKNSQQLQMIFLLNRSFIHSERDLVTNKLVKYCTASVYEFITP